ncbi:MAG: aspartate aminotransferase family protein [Desulfuromonadales bacterium]|nr:aspartate aminotransferase family protein [Desulfuromonadales bacterium]
MQRQKPTLFEQASDYAFHYLDKIEKMPVVPPEEVIADLNVFDESMPEEPQSPEVILELLHSHGSPGTVAQTGGRYFGFVNGSATPVAMAAKWLSDVWDQNTALYVMSPIVSKLEAVCQKWLVNLLGLPNETVAGFVSGSSTATLCGLAAGRNALLKKLGWDVNEQGMGGAPRIRVVLGEQAHGTVFKALAILGFGINNVEKVPIDSNGNIDLNKFPELDERCLVVLQAGNVNSGGFDPFDDICTRANNAGAWVHIDGAFGLWAAGAKTTRHLTKGIEKADSWSVDAHKTLNAPYDCGIVLCRHAEDLLLSMQQSGAYIQHSDKRDNMMYTPEMSRRNRAVELWATMKYFGRNGIEELVDRLCSHARLFAELLSREDFRVLNDVVFNQVLVACDTPEKTQATLKNIQASGECWCGGSSWCGEPVIRISVCSWATTTSDIERSVAAFVTCRELARL